MYANIGIKRNVQVVVCLEQKKPLIDLLKLYTYAVVVEMNKK